MVGISSQADIADYTIPDFFTPEHRPIVETKGLPTMLRDGCWEDELSFQHFTDLSRETEVRWSAFALRDEAGNLIGAAAFTLDISARKRAERALRDQQMLLASVLNNVPLGIGVYDSCGSLIHSNERMREYVGVDQLPSREPDSSRRWRGYDGANAARDFLMSHKLDPSDIEKVWTGIALHTTPGIPEFMHPVVALTTAGVEMIIFRRSRSRSCPAASLS